MALLSIISDGSSYHPPATVLDHFSDFLTTLSLVLIVLFTVTYAVFFRFWRRPAGLAIESVFISLTLYIAYAWFTRINTGGDYPGRDVVRLIVWILMPSSLTFLFVVLVVAWFKSGSVLKALVDVPQRQHPASPRQAALDSDDVEV